MFDVTRAYGLTFTIPANDVVIGKHLRNSGEFARAESDLIIDYVRAAGGGTYIDVGANIGSIALPVAAASSSTRVIAVEAQRELANILAANAIQNDLPNVSVIHAAASSATGLTAFPQPPLRDKRNFWNYGTVGFGVAGTEALPSENVRICTLEEIAPADTRFVKIDVEGHELEVLKGAERLIEIDRPCWLLEASPDKAETVYACMQRLRAANYNLFWFFAPFVTPQAQKLPRQERSTSGDINFLAVPRELDRNPWALALIEGDAPPIAVSYRILGYLQRYGYRIPAD